MKKSMKIVNMSEFHKNQTGKVATTPRKALVQGTLDIVAPRSPVQSFDSPGVPSSASSLISSRHSCAEDHHATPRRNPPPINSMYEEPQPERPSTSLDLSDDEGDLVDGVRPFTDASNIPRHRSNHPGTNENEEDKQENEPVEDDITSPFVISIGDCEFVSEEENQDSEIHNEFKIPGTVKSSSGGNKSSVSGILKANSTSICSGTGTKKKKKTGRCVESRYLSTSFKSSMGAPLLSSTALETSANTSTTAQISFRSRRPTSELKSSINSSTNKMKKEVSKPKKVITPRNTTTSDVSSETQDEELDYIYSVYIQYKYINTLAKNREEKQRRQFEAEFSTLWDGYRERQEKLTNMQKNLMYWESVHVLENSISEQITSLESLLKALPDFAERFSVLGSAIESTRHQLPIRDVVLPSPEELREWQDDLIKQATEASKLLEETVSFSSMPLETVERLSSIVSSLREQKSHHQQLFGAAKDILKRANKIFTEEASLRVDSNQRI